VQSCDISLTTIHICSHYRQFSDIQISQVTYVRCGGIFKYHFVVNLQMNLPVKEFWKSVKIWGSYGQEFSILFLTHGKFGSVRLSQLCEYLTTVFFFIFFLEIMATRLLLAFRSCSLLLYLRRPVWWAAAALCFWPVRLCVRAFMRARPWRLPPACHRLLFGLFSWCRLRCFPSTS